MSFWPNGGGSSGSANIGYLAGGNTIDVTNATFGARGSGVHDDTANIQAALDDAYLHYINGIYSRMYIPAGDYYITGELSVKCPMMICGEGGASRLFGGPIVPGEKSFFFRIAQSASSSGPYLFQQLSFQSGYGIASSVGGIGLHSNTDPNPQQVTGVTIQDVVYAGNGFGVWGTCFAFRCYSSKFLGQTLVTGPDATTLATQGGIAVWSGGGGVISGCEFQGNGTGASLYGYGWHVHGGRAEQNYRAYVTGEAPPGLTGISGAGNIEFNAIQMEANTHAYEITGDIISLRNLATASSYISPPNVAGGAKKGIWIHSGNKILVENCGINGAFQDAAIQVEPGVTNLTFRKTDASCELTGGGYDYSHAKAWDVRCDMRNVSFEETNYDVTAPTQEGGGSQAEVVGWDFLGGRSQRALSGADYRGTVVSQNISGRVTVTSGSSTVNVTFPVAQSDGSAALNTPTATTGGTLANGTYYCVASLVTPVGECRVGTEVSVTLSGGNNAFTITRNASPGTVDANTRWRLYVGTASGVYIGYLDLADGVQMPSTTVLSLTMDGYKSPSTAIASAYAATEPDTNYSVNVSPEWDAGGYWITSKSTTGFTINFHTAPGSDKACGWLLYR